MLGVSVVLALLPILLLWAFNVPLGQSDKFVYRYSPVAMARALSSIMLLPAALLLLAAVRLATFDQPPRRWAAYGLAALSIGSAVAWNMWAPPNNVAQHWFNFRSPSQDGAFSFESDQIGDWAAYLRQFDRRIEQSPEIMRGTRVINNPPLTTVLFRWVSDAWRPAVTPPGVVEQWFIDLNLSPASAAEEAIPVKHAIICGLALALSGAAAIPLGRLFLSPLGAIAFAVVVTLNPFTLHFNPGKDPGQLLTINLMLLAWFAGVRWRSGWLLFASGVVLAIGMGFGLIHLWVAVAALIATLWHRRRTSGMLHLILPTVAGGVAVCLFVYLAIGWNMPATWLAVAQRWGELQPTLGYRKSLWLWIGLPTVLLFVPAGLWLLIGSSLRRRWWKLPTTIGGRLAVSTVGVLLLVYFIGIPYELPRLWVAFVPVLVLGLMMQQPLLRGRSTRRVWPIVAAILLIHLLASAVHWALLDARESEYRAVSRRLFN